jgi:hypothetical protein
MHVLRRTPDGAPRARALWVRSFFLFLFKFPRRRALTAHPRARALSDTSDLSLPFLFARRRAAARAREAFGKGCRGVAGDAGVEPQAKEAHEGAPRAVVEAWAWDGSRR